MGGFFPSRMIGGEVGGRGRTYAQVLVDDYGADEVWSLVDIASGTTIHAHVNGNRDGSLLGWSLQNAAGPVTDSLAPYLDGSSDYGELLTTSLINLWDGSAGAFGGWFKVDQAEWENGEDARLFSVKIDGDNVVACRQDSNDGTLRFIYIAGGTVKYTDIATSKDTDWFSVFLTWDVNAGASGEAKAFYNGSQGGSTMTGLGTWAAGDLTQGIIGADDDAPQLDLECHMAYIMLRAGTAWTPTQIQNIHNAASTARADPS